MRYMILFLSAVLVTAIAPDAQAQSRKELDERLRAVESSMREIEPRVLAGDPAVIRLLERVDDMERQIRKLTSELEETQFENRQLRRDYEVLQEDFLSYRYAGAGVEGEAGFEFDPTRDQAARSQFGEGPVVLNDPNQDLAIVDPNDPNADAKRAATRPLGETVIAVNRFEESPDFVFAQAQTRLNEGAFGAAEDAYRRFLELSPEDPRAGEAHFWIGRVQLINSQPAAAAQSFIASMQRNGPKAPEAMVQLGVSLSALGERSEACRTLSSVNREFPNATDSVRRAAREAQADAGCG